MGDQSTSIPPLKANPGGQSADYRREVIGRDGLAQFCGRVLEGKSIVLSSDRRLGKTWFLKKLGAEAGDNLVWLFCEAEGVASVGQLLDCIYSAARSHLHFKAKVFARTLDLLEKTLGKTVGSFSVPAIEGVWKTAIHAIFDDLCGHADGRRVVLVIDEFPYLVHKLAATDKRQAMELLDVLRSLRQTHDAALRMILAGSIGLHLVIADLRQADYRNEPLNDTETVPVPPLDETWAIELARRLLAGAGIADHDDSLARALAGLAGRVPYYIHRLTFEMEKSPDEKWSPEDVRGLLTRLIQCPDDPLNLAHYRDRIWNYYPEPDQEPIFTLLDILAKLDTGMPVEQVLAGVCAAYPKTPPSRLASVLELLERDHYLQRTGQEVHFASPIVRQWWLYRRPSATPQASRP